MPRREAGKNFLSGFTGGRFAGGSQRYFLSGIFR